MFHHIQKSVIDVLASHDQARYGELKPATMDGNQFTYHLKQLLMDGYIVKNADESYSLTPKGRAYLVTRYESRELSAHSIFLVVIRCGDKLLLRERLVQPSLGYSGFIHGEPRADEALPMTLAQRVEAKTGLRVADIQIHGSGLIRLDRDSRTESFSHAIIASASVPDTNLPVIQDETGRNYWVEVAKLSDVDKLLPSCIDILAKLQSDTPFSWFDSRYVL